MRSPARLCVLALVGLAGLSCATPTGREQPWVEVETEHVRLYTSGGQALAIELARRLELFHALGRELLGEETVEERTPTYVYLLDAGLWYETLGAAQDVRGVLVQHPQANYVAVQEFSQRDEALRWAQNLYVRVIQQTRAGRAYPRWYEAGLGELLSTVEVHDDYLLIGRVPRVRRGLLDRGFRERNQRGVQRGAPRRGTWVPFGTVMRAGSISDWPRERRHMFQAEAWALVFYLTWKQPEDLARYLERVLDGQSHDEALAALGGSHRALEQKIERHFFTRSRLWRLPRERFEVRTEPKLRTLQPNEWLLALGELLIARRLPDQAERAELVFQRALAEDPELADAHAGLATALAVQGRGGGEIHIERALALAPRDAQIRVLAGEHFLARARAGPEVDQAALRRARSELEQALALASDLASAYHSLGLSHLLPGEDPRQALAPLESAHALVPWQRDIALALGEAHLRTGGDARARALLTSVIRGTRRDQTRERAEALLGQIEGEQEEPD